MKTNTPFSWRTPAVLMLFLAASLAFHSSSASAQTTEPAKPAPEVEQLKKRLQLLEQTVLELKAQIGAIEDKKTNPAPAIIDATYSEPSKPVEPAPETAPDKPQDNNNGRGESTFQIYGFAMLDAGYQFKQNHPDWFDVI
ncbi:MAG TPA: hypothetical protein VGD38_17195, partial [Pyrinomonadaceae bacterium]